MNVKYGDGRTQYGPGVSIELTGDEVATAIDAYLVAHGIHVSGPRTATVNGALCRSGQVYVDPSGFAIANGVKFPGDGPAPEPCTACEGRTSAGFEGQCPACANERARRERAEREP